VGRPRRTRTLPEVGRRGARRQERLEIVRWLGRWSFLTALLWFLGQFRNPPNGLPWSAIEAGLIVIGNFVVRRAAERGRQRR
jgi:hypothetical protein